MSLVRPTISIIFNADRSSNWSSHIETLARNLQPSAKPYHVVLGNPDRARDRHPARRGLQDRRDAFERRIRAGLAVDLQELRGHRALRLEQRAARRHHQLHRLRRRAARRPIGIEDAPRRRAAQARIRRLSEPPAHPQDGGHARRRRHRRCARPCAGPASNRLPGGGFGRFALKAQTNVVGSTIGLSGVNIELDGNAGEGVLTLANDGRQTLQGTLAAEGARSDALRLHRPAADQRPARLGPPADRARRPQRHRRRHPALRRPRQRRRMPGSAAPRSPPRCAAAISA